MNLLRNADRGTRLRVVRISMAQATLFCVKLLMSNLKPAFRISQSNDLSEVQS